MLSRRVLAFCSSRRTVAFRAALAVCVGALCLLTAEEAAARRMSPRQIEALQAAANQAEQAAEADAGVAEQDAGASATAPAAPDPAELSRRAQIFSRLGEVSLTLGEIEDDILRRSPFARRQFADRERLVAHAREMFRAKLLAHAAAERGFGERPSVRTLIDRHLVALVVRRQVDEPNNPRDIPTEAAQTYFQEHQELFVRAEQRRASHILVEEREEAARLLAQVREGDLRAFRRLAQEHSLDTETNQRGGDLGYFAADGRAAGGTDVAVNADIATLVFRLTREEPIATEPLELETTAGQRFAIVRMTGLREGAHPTFEQVEPAVRRRLAVERRDGAYRDYVRTLREQHQVQTQHLETLRQISLPPPPMPSHNHRGAEPAAAEGEGETDADGHMAP